jgi:predicted amidophosphoribosyltransferase
MHASIETRARRLLHPLVSFLLPTPCGACGSGLDALQLHGFCSRCWAALRSERGVCCRCCALPVARATDLALGDPAVCARCSARVSPIDTTVAAVEYDARARSVLLRAKLGGRREILGELARQVDATIRVAGVARELDAVLGLPSHPATNLRRGFAPGNEIARGLARRLDLPLLGGLRRRWFPWGSVKLRAARERRKLLEGSIAVVGRLPGRVLLVDDVMTTGATAEACAAAARRAGAVTVVLAVWARAQHQDTEE